MILFNKSVYSLIKTRINKCKENYTKFILFIIDIMNINIHCLCYSYFYCLLSLFTLLL